MRTPSLADLQTAFRAHVLTGDAELLVDAAVSDRIPAAARLRVYRHHVFTSLSAALGTTFATVRGVVGDDFFAGMARAFITRSPPAGPVLSEYGAAFADFVAQWPAAAQLPYLADVARLDWALNVAYTAPDSPALTGAQLAAVPPDQLGDLRLEPRAGVSLLCSSYPVDRIWALNHGGDKETVDLDAGGVTLLVFPRDDDAGFASLDSAIAGLTTALAAGNALGGAVEQTMQHHPDLDVGAALGRLLSLGALAALDAAG
ncbi:MAG: putative DNA-binding domain-containing protein [Alphaproteobacteria bacterium]|nr:putative DNA-binding domain-containing protein [Alphaproteobacteria bacterium]